MTTDEPSYSIDPRLVVGGLWDNAPTRSVETGRRHCRSCAHKWTSPEWVRCPQCRRGDIRSHQIDRLMLPGPLELGMSGLLFRIGERLGARHPPGQPPSPEILRLALGPGHWYDHRNVVCAVDVSTYLAQTDDLAKLRGWPVVDGGPVYGWKGYIYKKREEHWWEWSLTGGPPLAAIKFPDSRRYAPFAAQHHGSEDTDYIEQLAETSDDSPTSLDVVWRHLVASKEKT